MSLRADITTAYDEIAPPAPELQADIRRFVASESKFVLQSPGRRLPWVSTLRGSMALVAALLVVIIIATLLVGGRVWRDWNVFNSRPAPAGQSYAQQLAALEARPLHMPLVPPDAICPVGPNLTAAEAASFPDPIRGWARAGFTFSGGGPAYATVIALGGYLTGWGDYVGVEWVIEPQITGLVLVRGLDAVNHDLAVAYVGQYAAGTVIGTDTIDGKAVTQRAEVVLDAGHHPAAAGTSKWGVYEVMAGVPNTMSPCHVFQVDGEGFSEVFFTKPG